MLHVYTPLRDLDSIRIFELNRVSSPKGKVSGRLIQARLQDGPHYQALSYVWGDHTSNTCSILLDERPFEVTPSLYEALSALSLESQATRFWIDQISINQEDDSEKQRQVKIMASIFTQADMVIGWLGHNCKDSDVAFKLFRVLGVVHEDDRNLSRDRNRALHDLFEHGLIRSITDLFDPASVAVQAVRFLLLNPWFSRRWVVQEVVLASSLMIRCGSSSISGDAFFAAVRAMCSTITDPPLTWVRNPYWNAHRLGQLRERGVSNDRRCFVRLANVLSGWVFQKDQDRLNALWGLVDSEDPATAWFEPSYTVSGPTMYTNFARRHIDATGGTEREVQIHFDRPRGDLPSWTPDWRIFSRPVALDLSSSAAMPFTATTSTASYSFCGMQLRVLASKVDTVSICGMPYSPTLCDSLQTTAYEVFVDWLNLVKEHFPSPAWEPSFASTLVMDGKVKLVDHQDLEISTDEILSLFGHWLARNVCYSDNPDFGLEESTRYGNVAEEVCRNRRFFLTETGRMGLGPARIHPNASVYLIHGLKTPFVVDDRSEGDLLYGECFVHGLMYGEVSRSTETSTLRFR
ncbi:hypothetical protein LTR81_028043 [Elasticomyces elasticus]